MLSFCSLRSIIDNCGEKTIRTCNTLNMPSLLQGIKSIGTYLCSSVYSQTKAKELFQELEIVGHQHAPNHAVLPIYVFLELMCLKWDIVYQLMPFHSVVGHKLNI